MFNNIVLVSRLRSSVFFFLRGGFQQSALADMFTVFSFVLLIDGRITLEKVIAKQEIIPLTVPRHVTVNRVISKKLSLTVVSNYNH